MTSKQRAWIFKSTLKLIIFLQLLYNTYDELFFVFVFVFYICRFNESLHEQYSEECLSKKALAFSRKFANNYNV